MFGALRNHPYVFAVLVALLTAALAGAYAYTIDKDREATKKTFYKTLAAGAVAALALTWLVHRKEQICTEPFTNE